RLLFRDGPDHAWGGLDQRASRDPRMLFRYSHAMRQRVLEVIDRHIGSAIQPEAFFSSAAFIEDRLDGQGLWVWLSTGPRLISHAGTVRADLKAQNALHTRSESVHSNPPPARIQCIATTKGDFRCSKRPGQFEFCNQ